MGQGLGDAKGSLGLFKGVRAPVESQVAGEWRADERLFVGVEDDATLSALLLMSCSLEIIGESFLAKVSWYLGSFPYLFYSLGFGILLLLLSLSWIGPWFVRVGPVFVMAWRVWKGRLSLIL